MNLKRFFAVVKARNIEFFRDRSSLGWNLLFPILMLAGLSFVFSGDGKAVYKVGVVNIGSVQSTFMETRYVDFIDYQDKVLATQKLEQHAIDFLVDFNEKNYWVSQGSPNSYLVEKIFIGQHNDFQRLETYGKKIRYVDWVLPGILGMNMMFSCLFGVGYVIVRYRKNAVLKRLKATPLSAFEFVSAQLVSRIFIVMFMSSVVYIGCNLFFDFYMLGSYFDLFMIAILGAVSLISLGLLVASRSKSEELIGGLLNLTSWPMMLLSGVWFSLEGAPNAVKVLADFLPLTHLVAGARKVITEGATLADISYHVMALLIMSTIFLALGSYLFSWNTER
ncbi:MULTISPECIES: ABC transporter permease [unclassified Colwellia]|uniref:ABC transporter permease n=1 Tax=unclassified Colwellia TaxID=196834 RepID=UPI0015F4360F|nr:MULTISPECIES: ABC transporter permease [unclassified Colwellia]MBA6232452.1 ABC transporter permease [Colwellia sp. MB02u-7]MBA6238309.1 ABC transporter permease [Colwellia sp. MB02u-11]MBA6254559.1 ABC transporter permease [Colwellia sp. MB3u-28]MBA6258270.1 ABC transporter permease [Colwellia sp. MB3u-41]MBA6301059.1 ABC transporter permease [Colwellia sp. MB3u-22]